MQCLLPISCPVNEHNNNSALKFEQDINITVTYQKKIISYCYQAAKTLAVSDVIQPRNEPPLSHFYSIIQLCSYVFLLIFSHILIVIALVVLVL